MAAPQYVPHSPADQPRDYSSPPFVPAEWRADRPGDVALFQPSLDGMGIQGSDQGWAWTIAEAMSDQLHLQAGEERDSVMRAVVPVALRRAAIFSRSPTVHDLTVAFTVFGLLDPAPPAALVERRRALFGGLEHSHERYWLVRAVAHSVPDETLRMTPEAVTAAYPASWESLSGLTA